MERVLLISYHFPPSGGAKTRRLVQFLKYLPRSQWRPAVLTTRGGAGFGFDPSLLEEIPEDVRVHRAFDLSALLGRGRLAASAESAATRGAESGGTPLLRQATAEPAALGKTDAPGLARRAVLRAGKWIALPDAYMPLWGLFAGAEGLRVVRREGITLLYATGPPFSNHLVGACLKQITGRPLILDFRDAWTVNPARRMKYAGARRRIESRLEAFVLRRAAVVVGTTEGITEDLRRRYQSESAARFVTVPNGYDRADRSIAGETPRAPGDRMRIVHTGHLRLERSPRPLFAALRQLLDEAPELEAQLEVDLVGETHRFLDGRTIRDYLAEFRLQSVVRLVGPVSRPEAICYQAAADLLLLIIGVVPPEEVATYGIASKVFDYMLAGRPVLTLADPGPVRDLVARTRIGPAFSSSDVEGIKRYLSEAVAAFRQGRLGVEPDRAEIERYDVRNLALRLVEESRDLARG
jgi:hypothetical protein